MLDEPLGSLDRTLRERLMLDLRGILRELGQTALYVTHDQEEAFAVADRVVLMKAGEVVQVGTPEEIYREPASLFVARFLGLSNFLKGRIIERGGEIQLETEIGSWPWEGQPGEELTVLLRPDQVRLDGRGPARLRGEVVERSFRGSLCRAVIEVEGTPLVFDFSTNQSIPEAGGAADLSFDPNSALQALR
jgi:ABC-type Fe3+/spermidine/putrescine transport system ATPase subunit